VEKDVDSAVERFVYSGIETVVVYDGSNNWLREFVFGSVIDEVLMMNQPDVLDADEDEDTSEHARSFYHHNALGSVMEITEMDEDVAVSYRYDPYGAVTITRNSTPQSSDPLGNPWVFTARFSDEETGLYYYRARAYSPSTARFLQRDPVSYAAGPNLYQYVDGNPTNRVDPLGLVGGSATDIIPVADQGLFGWRIGTVSAVIVYNCSSINAVENDLDGVVGGTTGAVTIDVIVTVRVIDDSIDCACFGPDWMCWWTYSLDITVRFTRIVGIYRFGVPFHKTKHFKMGPITSQLIYCGECLEREPSDPTPACDPPSQFDYYNIWPKGKYRPPVITRGGRGLRGR
jgi:RHS repeat-associated protein